MMQASASNLADSERAELESVLAALARTPRLAKLLSYVAERYFAARIDEITEYNIATEVFGRSKTTFDSSQDSIARVEAYRLRKRLKEYYQTEGKEHRIQIALPSGSYVPSFIRGAATAPAASRSEHQIDEDEAERWSSALEPETAPDFAETTIIETDQPGSQVRLGRSPYRLAAVAALLLLAFGAVWFFWPHRSTNQPKTGPSTPPTPNQPTPQNAAQVPLRLLAGYDGSPRIDSAGAYWQADRYFTGEAGFTRPDTPVART